MFLSPRKGHILPVLRDPNLEGSCYFANSEGSQLGEVLFFFHPEGVTKWRSPVLHFR